MLKLETYDNSRKKCTFLQLASELFFYIGPSMIAKVALLFVTFLFLAESSPDPAPAPKPAPAPAPKPKANPSWFMPYRSK